MVRSVLGYYGSLVFTIVWFVQF